MKDLRGNGGLAALRALPRGKTLFAFDFDGTLAEIRNSPGDVTVEPAVQHMLLDLEHAGPVAVITGRERSDVLRFFRTPPSIVIGNHGLEGEGFSDTQGLARQSDRWRKHLEHALAAKSDEAWLENKTFSLTVHSRNSTVLNALETSAKRMSELPPVRLIRGINTLNVIPAGGASKGTAVLNLLEAIECERAIYVGDEETDESVFALEDPRILGIRIGRHPSSAAPFFLSSQKDIVWLLAQLVAISH